jgi:uncharacterized membrane protein
MDRIFSKKYTKLRILILLALLCISLIMILNTYFLTVRQQGIVETIYVQLTTDEQKYNDLSKKCVNDHEILQETSIIEGDIHSLCDKYAIDRMFEKNTDTNTVAN